MSAILKLDEGHFGRIQREIDRLSPADDDEEQREEWLNSVGFVEALGMFEIEMILEAHHEGKSEKASKRYWEALNKGWEKESKEREASQALAKAYKYGKVPEGYDD
jgi:ADP-heptose:LPS heptosyltransferase